MRFCRRATWRGPWGAPCHVDLISPPRSRLPPPLICDKYQPHHVAIDYNTATRNRRRALELCAAACNKVQVPRALTQVQAPACGLARARNGLVRAGLRELARHAPSRHPPEQSPGRHTATACTLTPHGCCCRGCGARTRTRGCAAAAARGAPQRRRGRDRKRAQMRA